METSKNSGYGKRPFWQWVAIYALVAVIVYGLVYYLVIAKKNTYNASQTNQSPVITTLPTLSPEASSSSSSVQSSASSTASLQIAVNGTEFAFSPPTFTVKAGEPVKLIFSNDGTYPHNLAIPDLNIKTQTIKPGERDTITFTPQTAGTFPYLCTVPGHADKGMKGTMTVE